MNRSLGEFEIVVLAAVLRLGEGAYGASVRRTIESETTRSISIGAVYTTLRRLQKKGYVSAWMGEPTPERGGRAKRFFRVESAGRTALRSSLENIRRITHGLPEAWAG